MAEHHEVFRGGKLHVLSERCSTCIFRAPSDGQIKYLRPGLITELVRGAQADPDGAGTISCHSTIHRGDDVRPAICRGFWDLPRVDGSLMTLAELMGLVEQDEPPAKEVW